eukprot:TRINITY_DN13005_c0_g1_i1.p1 TRINITY_DN13005_c0_g1~~TRINITY_DN13005_c0_g1_i1.p1  ORF type:complete len:685 (-),score=92.29 TRINITY_DN13005_c0_g1_i1:121-2175(-)
MVHVVVRKQDVVVLVLDFLKQNGMIRAMRSLEVETGLRVDLFGKEIQHIRDLILDGNWDGIERFLRPYQKRIGAGFRTILFSIRKQRFLEAVEYQHLNPAVVQLVDGLKDLENQCSPQEFNELCYIITLPRISDHPRYGNWSPMKGRQATFETIFPLLEVAFGSSFQGQDFQPNRLERLLKQSLSYQISRWRVQYPHAPPLPTPLYATLLEDFGYAEPSEPSDHAAVRLASIEAMGTIGIEFKNMEVYDPGVLEAEEEPSSPKMRASRIDRDRPDTPNSRSPSPVSRHTISRPLATHPQKMDSAYDQASRPSSAWNIDPPVQPRKKPDVILGPPPSHKKIPANIEGIDNVPGPLPPSRSMIEAGLVQKLRPFAVFKDIHIVRSMSIHPRLACAAIGGNSRNLNIISLEQTEELESLQEMQLVTQFTDQHQGSIYSTSWNCTGRLLATGSNDQRIVVVGLEDDFLLDKNREIVLRGHDGTIRDLAFSPTTPGLLISGGSGDRRFRVWDAIRGRCLHPHDGHTGTITSVKFNRDGSVMASAAEDGMIRLWDARTPKCTMTITPNNGEISSISFCPTYNIMTATFANASCYMIDVASGRTFYELRRHKAHCTSVDYFSEGDWFLTGSYDCGINVVPCEMTMSGRTDLGTLVRTLSYHADKVLQVRCHPTRFSFLSSCADRTVVLWDS